MTEGRIQCCLLCHFEYFDEEQCPSCEAEEFYKQYDIDIQTEVDRYNERTGEQRIVDDFIFKANEISVTGLYDCPMLHGYIYDFKDQYQQDTSQLKLNF